MIPLPEGTPGKGTLANVVRSRRCNVTWANAARIPAEKLSSSSPRVITRDLKLIRPRVFAPRIRVL